MLNMNQYSLNSEICAQYPHIWSKSTNFYLHHIHSKMVKICSMRNSLISTQFWNMHNIRKCYLNPLNYDKVIRKVRKYTQYTQTSSKSTNSLSIHKVLKYAQYPQICALNPSYYAQYPQILSKSTKLHQIHSQICSICTNTHWYQ